MYIYYYNIIIIMSNIKDMGTTNFHMIGGNNEKTTVIIPNGINVKKYCSNNNHGINTQAGCMISDYLFDELLNKMTPSNQKNKNKTRTSNNKKNKNKTRKCK